MAEEYRTFMKQLNIQMVNLIKSNNELRVDYNNNTDRLIEVHNSLLHVHTDIMVVVQQMSNYMSQANEINEESARMLDSLKTMINGIVGMTANVEHTYKLLDTEGVKSQLEVLIALNQEAIGK